MDKPKRKTTTLTMKAVQLLASIAVFSSISFSQEDKAGKEHTNYLLFDNKISVEEITRIGERRSELMRENAEEKEYNESSLSSFLTKISNAYKLRKLNNDIFRSPGFKWFDNTDNSTGKAFVCGPEGAHLNISWKPKIISTEKPIQIYLDIVYPIDFKEGLARIDVYRKGIPDPVFSVDEGITCTDINNWVPFIRCPIKRGNSFSFSFKYSETQLQPVGSYTVLLKIVSYAAKPPPLFACLNFSLQIESSKLMSASETPQTIAKTSENIV